MRRNDQLPSVAPGSFSQITIESFLQHDVQMRIRFIDQQNRSALLEDGRVYHHDLQEARRATTVI